MAKKKLPTSLNDIFKSLDKAPLPEMPDIAAEFVLRAGGSKRFGQLLWEEFLNAEPGSLMRSRIIDVVLKCMKGADRTLDKDALDRMSTTELEDLYLNLMGRVNEQPSAGHGAEAGQGEGQAEGAPAPAAQGGQAQAGQPPV